MIRQLAHLNFITRDLSRIIDFYVNKLGLQIYFTLKNKEGIPFGYYFGCGNTTFLEFFDQELAVKEWGGSVCDLELGTQYNHFCLEVVDLETFRKELVNRRVDVSGISKGMDNSLQAWISDPDGNRIELMQYSHTSLQLIGEVD